MKRTCAAIVVVLGFTGALIAHETWLLPAAFSVPAMQDVAFDLTSGMEFPALDHAIRRDRIARAGFRLGSVRTELKEFAASAKSLRLTQSFPRDGVATVWLELKPRSLELTPEKVAEYFDEIGAGPELRASWEKLKGSKTWKETYTKHAKTFVAVGDARSDPSWKDPLGTALELVPVSDPLSLRVEQPATFRLLSKGKPLAKMPVGLLIEGAKERAFQSTDAAGQVTFPIGRAGPALLFAVSLRRTPDDAAWESDFATLTVGIQRP